MNENKLLACKIKPYTVELDEGQIVNVKDEVWVGYWNSSGEFSAVCLDRIEDGRLVGGDSVTVTKEEFDEKAEKVIDIFGDTESYNVRYLLSLSQTQIADYDKRIAELEEENAKLKEDNDARKFAMAMSEKVEKQLREENAKLKEIIKDYLIIVKGGNITVCSVPEENRCINVLELNEKAEQFLKEVEK